MCFPETSLRKRVGSQKKEKATGHPKLHGDHHEDSSSAQRRPAVHQRESPVRWLPHRRKDEETGHNNTRKLEAIERIQPI